MPDVAFAQDVMRGYVETRPGENLKQKLGSASHALGWAYSRAKAVLYGEARVIKSIEMDQLCRAAKVERQARSLAHDHDELTERLARMEAMLASLMASAGRPVPDGSEPFQRGRGPSVGA